MTHQEIIVKWNEALDAIEEGNYRHDRGLCTPEFKGLNKTEARNYILKQIERLNKEIDEDNRKGARNANVV